MRAFIFCMLALFLLGGCATENRQSLPPKNGNNVQVRQTEPSPDLPANANQVAEHLEQLALQIPKVQGANCVVFGNTAIVGIDVEGNLSREQVGTVKYSVAEALRKDPYGIHAIVTADVDLYHRLQNIRKEMREGRPISGFAKEMADIVGRIVPQFPKDINPQNNPPAENEDSRKLNDKEA